MRFQVVSFRCVLKNRLGELISSTVNHDVSTRRKPGEPEVLPGLAEGLRDLRAGEHRVIRLQADQAYGLYDPSLVVERSRSGLSGGRKLKVGDQVAGMSDDGRRRLYRVIQATDRTVTFDGNHPLAGQDLVFEIDALDVRFETEEESVGARPLPRSEHLH